MSQGRGAKFEWHRRVLLLVDALIADRSPVTLTERAVAIGVASTIVLQANADRRYALFVNDSAVVIYLSVDSSEAAVNRGIRLNANGGSYEMGSEFGNLVTGQINAIHGLAGNRNLLIVEGV